MITVIDDVKVSSALKEGLGAENRCSFYPNGLFRPWFLDDVMLRWSVSGGRWLLGHHPDDRADDGEADAAAHVAAWAAGHRQDLDDHRASEDDVQAALQVDA